MAPHTGWKHSDEAKARIAEAMRKRYRERPDIAKRMWEGSKRPRSSETKQRLAAAQVHTYEYLDGIPLIEWAYIAGLFDGEGWVGIVRRTGRNGRCILMISLGNTNRPVIDWLKAKLRGHVAEGSPKRDPRWKHHWVWSANQTHAAAILRNIAPFLIIKKPATDLALLFQEARFCSIEEQTEFRLRMNAINRRCRPIST